ncbi:HD-GYP domain-containing protein [Tepidimonas sp.]|uniref:HD-GYP domain-containing protein n=1 Tax=Tepidimonas sp. TaxID=2002775 RepID=UPI002FDF9A64
MFVPLPVEELALGEPLPVDIYDGRGQLLLRKGQAIRDARHRDWIAMHRPTVRREDFQAWTYRYNAAIDRALRDNRSLEAIASVGRPMGVEADDDDTPDVLPLSDIWADLHAGLMLLLHQGEHGQDFLGRFQQLERRFEAVVQPRIDPSVFVLVQMLYERPLGYSATHAWLCALLAGEVAASLGWPVQRQRSLRRAAMTMNLGMGRLHDDLARQDAPLSAEQRHAVREHPLRGEVILRRLGVQDPLWLELVRDHHERAGGLGYPHGRTQVSAPAQLLQLVDVYVARLSPRHSRPGLPAPQAARDVYMDASGMPTPLGTALIQAVGLYLPGSYVQLASGEIGVVARRGRRAHTPLVFAIVGRDGLPKGEAPLRDTAQAPYAVRRAVGADAVKVRIPLARLLARL